MVYSTFIYRSNTAFANFYTHLICDCGNGVLYERICGFFTINGTAMALLQYGLSIFDTKVNPVEAHTVCPNFIFGALKDARRTTLVDVPTSLGFY